VSVDNIITREDGHRHVLVDRSQDLGRRGREGSRKKKRSERSTRKLRGGLEGGRRKQHGDDSENGQAERKRKRKVKEGEERRRWTMRGYSRVGVCDKGTRWAGTIQVERKKRTRCNSNSGRLG
jgi:hypothetical protein